MIQGEVEIKKGLEIPYVFEKTSKGNGVLTIGGLGIRSYDAHRDTMLFEGFLLRHQFIDVNQDGYRDLVLSGIVLLLGEKEIDPVSHRATVAVFLFDPKTKKLNPTVTDEAIYFWNIPADEAPQPTAIGAAHR